MYGIDVHQFLVKFLAEQAGFDKKTATKLGIYGQSPDLPGSPKNAMQPNSLPNYKGMINYHFASLERVDELRKKAFSTGSLEDFGVYIHVFQDTYSHTRGKGGRGYKSVLKQRNHLYNASKTEYVTKLDYYGGDGGGLVGHLFQGYDVDYTWNDTKKSMKMAQQAYLQMVRFAKKKGVKPSKIKKWSQIEKQVRKFVEYKPKDSEIFVTYPLDKKYSHIPLNNISVKAMEEKIKILDPTNTLPTYIRKEIEATYEHYKTLP